MKIDVDPKELSKVYFLLEELNVFFHQEENYENLHSFAEKNYERIHECYYKIVWNWLPDEMKESFLNE